MNQAVTIRREGSTLAVAIPQDVAEEMNVAAGDKLYLVRTDHGLALVPTAPARTEGDQAVREAYHEVVKQYDDTLRRLAQ